MAEARSLVTGRAAVDRGVRGPRIAQIETILDRAAATRSLFLRMDGDEHLSFVPGQFISISIPLPDETRTRPYSIASSPEDRGPIEICFNRVPDGRGVAWLFEREVGDGLVFTGPFGVFTLGAAPAEEVVFIAEGTAIAPIRPMLRRALSAPEHPRVSLLYAAVSPDRLLYHEELMRLADEDGRFDFSTVTADPARIYEMLARQTAARWVSGTEHRKRRFYICGIGNEVLRLRDLLRGAGYDRRAVRYERW